VADDYIQVAKENVAFGKSRRNVGDTGRAVFHEGLSEEMLALLELNEGRTARKFATPSTARNDSGYYSPKLTHDLMIFMQRGGKIKSMLPSEVKTRMSKQARKRYKALIIDGVLMDALGAGEPGPMIELYARVYRGDASSEDVAIAKDQTKKLWDMVSQYSAGKVLEIGHPGSVIQFHDSSKVKLGGYATTTALAA